jgi:hypothetical protein
MTIVPSQGLGVRSLEFNEILHHTSGQKPLQEEATLYGDWKLFQPDEGVAVLDVIVRTHRSSDQSAHHDAVIWLCCQNNLTKELGCFIQVGFGTPAQTHPVLLDTSSLNTFILSVDCDSYAAAIDNEKGYNSSASSTHKDNGTSVELDYHYLTPAGRASQDTMTFGPVEIQDQGFQESPRVQWQGVSYNDVWIMPRTWSNLDK